MPRALICGVGGQDGWYLTEYLQSIGYKVYGGYRRSSNQNLPDCEPVPLELTEYESIKRAVDSVQPDEIYNLGAQSHVGESFNCPLYTSDVNHLGVLRLLEVVRGSPIRLYQASTSEMFGDGRNLVETSPFAPRSPYAVSKLAAHHSAGIYRKAYRIRVSCGILFNHESPRRGREFVTRKITWHTARNLPFTLANVDSVRDWGHAKDYVRAMHLMLQHAPDDFVISTGESRSIKELLATVTSLGYKPNYSVVEAEERPWDVKVLEGSSDKARVVLNWSPLIGFKEMIGEMLRADEKSVHTTTPPARIPSVQS